MKKWTGDLVFVLVVAGLIVGWMYLYPSPNNSLLSPIIAPVDVQTPPSASYASEEGLKLAYRLYAPETEPHHVLVLLHDSLLHGGWYGNLGRDLAQKGIAVYLPDRRGRGYSEGDWREVAKDRTVLTEDITAMIAAAQARYPQAGVTLGGHGRAAGLVMDYLASRRPLKAAILISPYISDDQPNIRPEGWRAFLRAHPVEAFLAESGLVKWRVWTYGWPSAMIEADPLIETKSSIIWHQETLPLDPNAAYQTQAPILCLEGQNDPLFYADRTESLLAPFAASDVDLETLPEVDYLSIVDAAADPIADWLSGK